MKQENNILKKTYSALFLITKKHAERKTIAKVKFV